MSFSLLSKTDFKSAFDCAAKLYYRKGGYPTTRDDNEYMAFLADSGFMVEFIAKSQFPQGVDVTAERDPHVLFEKTRSILAEASDAVVFEGGFIHGKFYARADILRRDGDQLHLIEVKSSSWSGDEHDENPSAFLTNDGKVKSDWKPYLIDVAYQQHILSYALPEFKIVPWLWLVNRSARVSDHETAGRFRIVRPDGGTNVRPLVRYDGNVEELQRTGLLARLNVGGITEMLMPEVIQRAMELASILEPSGSVRRPGISLAENYKVCRTCEYRFSNGEEPVQHGFAECWGDLASARPHILDLYRVGQIGSTKVEDPVPALISNGQASLLALKDGQFGAPGGAYTARRRMQWTHSADGGSEHLPDILLETLRAFETSPGYPFHFIDFEACDVVLPHHAGLRPYERVAFQWSCHTLHKGGELQHTDWLNTERLVPQFNFAKALRSCIGETGTVFVWSSYEQTTLQKILAQIRERLDGSQNEALLDAGFELRDFEDLADWIERLLGPEDAKRKRKLSPRIRDLHKLAEEHYFHPSMRGRTSIKAVLPAIWQQSELLRRNPWFSDYHKTDALGQVLDPYQTLPPLPLGDEDDEYEQDVVKEGTGAIRIYQELIFWEGAKEKYRENHEKLLRQYCKLDTAAMVMIWAHWSGRA